MNLINKIKNSPISSKVIAGLIVLIIASGARWAIKKIAISIIIIVSMMFIMSLINEVHAGVYLDKEMEQLIKNEGAIGVFFDGLVGIVLYIPKAFFFGIVQLLRAIIERFNGGPVGLEALASSIGEESSTIEDVYEPYLLKEGYIKRTPRGRVVTDKTYDYLKIEK